MFYNYLRLIYLKIEEKIYYLVGTNICWINAFFVKKELAKDLFPDPPTSENLYHRFDVAKHMGFFNDVISC
jgi:hypothetical protein